MTLKNPFPGMNPYLEQPSIWNQIHTSLIIDIQRFLAPLIYPNYRVIIEQLTYLSLGQPTNGKATPTRTGKPDNLIISPKGYQPAATNVATVAPTMQPHLATLPLAEQEIHRFLEIRDAQHEVITVLEILSPVNKSEPGRTQYLAKRQSIVGSLTHLVEIDLLRGGTTMPMDIQATNDYRILISRQETRPTAEVYLFGIKDPIPDIPIPLRQGDDEPLLTLNTMLHQVYELGYYANLIDYSQPPTI